MAISLLFNTVSIAEYYNRPCTHHSQIKSSIGEGRSVVVDVVEHALGNLQHSLVDDVLVGPAQEPLLEQDSIIHLRRAKPTGCQT